MYINWINLTWTDLHKRLKLLWVRLLDNQIVFINGFWERKSLLFGKFREFLCFLQGAGLFHNDGHLCLDRNLDHFFHCHWNWYSDHVGFRYTNGHRVNYRYRYGNSDFLNEVMHEICPQRLILALWGYTTVVGRKVPIPETFRVLIYFLNICL